ncbi:MAG: sarcosine oxidase subunit gamma SoxG [Deltaproteobacteria bacterium]|nr:MAG: sarcosine oxidase subunit gamma SoxG [Deltaproteobacteria bacterium]
MGTMELYRRRTPVAFQTPPSKKEIRDGWEVVLEYEDQGNGPFLIDLSHIPKWDVQDADLAHIRPMDVTIPDRPGDCILERGLLISRMNATQAIIWHLSETHPAFPQEPAYTDVSDANALVAILAKDLFHIMEKVTPLDLSTPSKAPPFLLQGPVLHVRCQVVLLGEKGGYTAVLIALPRGYAQSVCEALLDAGMEWGLSPAGETAFRDWLKQG